MHQCSHPRSPPPSRLGQVASAISSAAIAVLYAIFDISEEIFGGDIRALLDHYYSPDGFLAAIMLFGLGGFVAGYCLLLRTWWSRRMAAVTFLASIVTGLTVYVSQPELRGISFHQLVLVLAITLTIGTISGIPEYLPRLRIIRPFVLLVGGIGLLLIFFRPHSRLGFPAVVPPVHDPAGQTQSIGPPIRAADPDDTIIEDNSSPEAEDPTVSPSNPVTESVELAPQKLLTVTQPIQAPLFAGCKKLDQPVMRGQIYVVQLGDILSCIAARAGVSLESLQKVNPQITNPDLIHPGDRVTIPAS